MKKSNLFLFLSIVLAGVSCTSKKMNSHNKHISGHHKHTLKLNSDFKLFFKKKTRLHIEFSEALYTEVILNVIHKDTKGVKQTLKENLKMNQPGFVTLNTSKLEDGLLVAIVSYKDKNKNLYSKVATYRLSDQEEIEKAKKTILLKNRK